MEKVKSGFDTGFDHPSNFPLKETKTTHLLFGLVIDESVVLYVCCSTVLICLVQAGQKLHGLLHGDFSCCDVAI